MPALFQLVREVAVGMDSRELYRTLNMGVGMVLVCSPDDVAAVQELIAEPTWIIGQLTAADDAGRTVTLS